MADENLRLRASVDYDGKGLRNLRADLQGVSNFQAAKALAKDWKGVSTEIDKASAGIRSTFMPAMSSLGLSSLGVVGGLTAIGSAVRNFSSNTQSLSLFSKEIGITTDRIRSVTEMGARFGVAAESVKGALETFSATTYEIKKHGAAYGALVGMNVAQLAEDIAKAGNNQEALTKAFMALQRVSDPEARKRLSTVLFGTPDIARVAAALGEDFQKAIAEIETKQGHIDERMEGAARKFEENMSRMRTNMDNLRINALGPLLEGFNNLVPLMGKEITLPTLGSTGAANDPKSALVERQDQIRRQIDTLESLGNAGPGGMPRSSDMQRKIDRLNEELKNLSEEIKKLNAGSGATVQQQSFRGGGSGMGGLIQQASLGGGMGSIVGPGFAGGPGGGRGGFGGHGGAGDGVPGSESGAGGRFAPRAPEEAGKYRPVYKLSDHDLDPRVINTIAGEVSTKNPQGVDAVINNMLNRVGAKGWGPSGNLLQVARARGQYEGYRRAAPAEAAFIGERIRAIASGGVPDNTGGANSFRAAWYNGPWRRRVGANGTVIGGNRFAYDPSIRNGPYAPYGEGAPEKVRAASAPWPNQWSRRGANQFEAGDEMGATSVGGRSFGDPDLLGRSMQMNSPQKVEGSARLEIDVRGLPASYKAKTTMDGMFKDVRLNRGGGENYA